MGKGTELKPLAIDLYCGLGGWSSAFLSEGYDVIGFDNERHVYGEHRYPGQLVLQDVLTIDGARFRDASVIVASPPCQEPSYRAMPWSRAKALNAAGPPVKFMELFEACFRIQREASAAAGRHIPLIVENVKGAQPWVGRAKWHYGSFYLWGDVPALMPVAAVLKGFGGTWVHNKELGTTNPNRNRTAVKPGVKVPNHTLDKVPGVRSVGFNVMAVRQMKEAESDAVKNGGNGTWFGKSHGVEYPGQPGNARDGRKLGDAAYQEGAEVPAGTGKTSWFFGNTKHELRATSSGSNARKQASAMIAKIPFPLAAWIARCYYSSYETDKG